jgi:hypothetical protein
MLCGGIFCHSPCRSHLEPICFLIFGRTPVFTLDVIDTINCLKLGKSGWRMSCLIGTNGIAMLRIAMMRRF